MTCQVGITTDPDRRRREWEGERPSLRNWQILGHYPSRTTAQQAENREARRRGCNSGVGGSGPERALWYVYRFDY